MPSPIAHIAIGYWVYRSFKPHMEQPASVTIGRVPLLLVATLGLTMLPDLDVLPGLLMGDVFRFHNGFAGSPVFGLLVALLVGGAVWLKWRSGFWAWFLLALVSYQLHILADFFGFGRGAMLAWPFSQDRFDPPFLVFYGLHHSQGWVSISHLWTVLSEIGFVVALWLLMSFSGRLRKVRLR